MESYSRARRHSENDTGVLGEHTLEITDDGLVESTEVNRSLSTIGVPDFGSKTPALRLYLYFRDQCLRSPKVSSTLRRIGRRIPPSRASGADPKAATKTIRKMAVASIDRSNFSVNDTAN